MKIRLYRFITVIALMLMTPLVMACGSCHDSTGVDIVYQVSKTDVTSVNASGIVTAERSYMQATALSVPAIEYIATNKRVMHRKTNNSGYMIRTVLVTAYPGRYQHAGVTTA